MRAPGDEPLSSRGREVLALVAGGTPNRGIAARPYACCQSAGVFGGSQPGWAWWPWRQRYVEPP
ncbi:hypothetical protein SALBM135S_06173 [Streptomyces alboniger]